jgi:hypothetical protein
LRAVISGTLQSGDPSDCNDHMTARYLEQTTALRGPAAVNACRKAAVMGGEAKSVDIQALHIRGDHAGGRMAVNGGFSDGTTMTVTFVKRRQWQFDRVTRMRFDRPRVDRAMVKSVTRVMEEAGAPADLDGLERQTKSCFSNALRAMSDAQLEHAVVDSAPAVLIRPFLECGMRVGIEAEAGDELPEDFLDCLMDGVMARVTDAEIMHAVRTGEDIEGAAHWEAIGEKVAAACDDAESGAA